MSEQDEHFATIKGLVDMYLGLAMPSPLDEFCVLQYTDDGELERDCYVPGSLHWMHYQRLLAEHDLIERVCQAQVANSAGNDITVASALIAVGLQPIRELRYLEQFMLREDMWLYEHPEDDDEDEAS